MEDTVLSTSVLGADFMHLTILLSKFTHGFLCTQENAQDLETSSPAISLTKPVKTGGCPVVQDILHLPSLNSDSDSTDPDQLFEDDHVDLTIPDSGCSKVRTCPICGDSCVSGLALERHLCSIHLISQSYTCAKCTLSFNNACQLSSHVANVHNLKWVHCKKCAFKSMSMAQMHQHVHWHMQGCRCAKCTKWFSSLSTLWAHEKLHAVDRPDFVCDLCNSKYKTKSALCTHVVGKHRGGFCCPRCAQCFDTPMQCSHHVRRCGSWDDMWLWRDILVSMLCFHWS